jgi:hypothetical protein
MMISTRARAKARARRRFFANDAKKNQIDAFVHPRARTRDAIVIHPIHPDAASARPAEMISTHSSIHPSIRAVSRPTRDVAFARAMDANARVKKIDASDSRTSCIDRVDAG